MFLLQCVDEAEDVGRQSASTVREKSPDGVSRESKTLKEMEVNKIRAGKGLSYTEDAERM